MLMEGVSCICFVRLAILQCRMYGFRVVFYGLHAVVFLCSIASCNSSTFTRLSIVDIRIHTI